MTVASKSVSGVQPPTWHRRKDVRTILGKIMAFTLLTAGAILFLVPVVWMLSSSLKANDLLFDGRWIPRPAVWGNYASAWAGAPFALYFKNTLTITVFAVVGSVISSSLVAYPFARMEWPGRDLLFFLVLGTMLLPGIVTFIPQYILFSKIGWVDTFLPLIVPSWLGSAFYIFLLRQFFRTIPMELSDAARIDGAGELRIWWQIIMPLSRPALAAVTIFSFTGVWEDYFGPLIYLSDPNKFTLQLGLKAFASQPGVVPQWNYLMAVGLLIMIPVIVVFFIGQRYFIEGITLTGLKG